MLHHKVQEELQHLPQSLESSIGYVLAQRSGNHLLKITLTNQTLVQWREIKKSIPNITFLEIYRCVAPDLPFDIKCDSPRLEERLRVLSSIAANECRGTVGYTREKLLKKTKAINVYGHELVNVSNLYNCVHETERENLMLKKKLKELDERCENVL